MSDFNEDNSEGPSVYELVCQLKQIEKGLRCNLSILRKQLSVIESKPELLSQLTIFKNDMEMQASNLEADVKLLREDIRSIKELLGLTLKKQNLRNS